MMTLLLLCAILAVGAGEVQAQQAPQGSAALLSERKNQAPTCREMHAAYDDIKKAILATKSLDEDGNLYFRLIPGFVRLSFHMCLGKKCRGCLNVNDANNVHLEQLIDVLERLYKRHSTRFRRADFWALAGIAALRTSEEITNVRLNRNFTFMSNNLGFRYGRQDCSPPRSSPFTNAVHEFPDPNKGVEHVLKFFADNFNFSPEEAVVILGAHNLGGLRNRTTHRIIRQWTSPTDNLINSYYINLRNASNQWTQTILTPCPTCPLLWFFVQGTGKRLMLNVDMSLLKNLTFPDATGGPATCTFQTCPYSDTQKFVNEYADSDAVWQQDFSRVYMRMIETGYEEGELKTPYGCPTVTLPPDSK